MARPRYSDEPIGAWGSVPLYVAIRTRATPLRAGGEENG